MKTDANAGPLVSIVIPVYNNAEHFPECLESVLAQTYRNWECTIVNNCSTDGSAEIARSYAQRDSRIRVIDNKNFLTSVANHNWALSHVSAGSKYCKMIFADDLIFPHCLQEMIAVAECNPSAAIIGAYGLMGPDPEVKWAGLSFGNHLTSGREIGRRYFLDRINVFGSLHSLLFRADVIRSRTPFLNEANLQCDREVCLSLLKTHDFAFAFQILTFTRVRSESLFAYTTQMNLRLPAELYEVITYGRDFLGETDYRRCFKKRFNDYYNFLALAAMWARRNREFWDLHKHELDVCGLQFSRVRLARAAIARIARAILNPIETLGRLLR